jgi:hypothetical protein
MRFAPLVLGALEIEKRPRNKIKKREVQFTAPPATVQEDFTLPGYGQAADAALFRRHPRPLNGVGRNKLQENGHVCHSERSEESLLVLSQYLNRREILRFAGNDIVLGFSAACLPSLHETNWLFTW